MNYDFEITTRQSCAHNLSFWAFNRRKVFKFGQNASEIILYFNEYTIWLFFKDDGFFILDNVVLNYERAKINEQFVNFWCGGHSMWWKIWLFPFDLNRKYVIL